MSATGPHAAGTPEADGLTIRRATPEDEGAIIQLIRESMGPDDAVEWSAEFWRWKHERNPFGTSPVLVAEDAGRLVGLRTFMRWMWTCEGRPVPAVRAVDTATHPDYRGRGIFRRLTVRLRDEMGEEGVAMVFNTPNDKSRPGYLKMGWEVVGNPTVWVRPVRPLRAARGLLSGDGSPLAPTVRAEAAVTALDSPGVASIVDAAGAGGVGRYHTAPTLDYLRWRYGAIPGSDYHVAVRGDGSGGALLVVKTRLRGRIRELRVCDVVANESAESRRNARVLLRRAGRLAHVDAVIVMPTPEARWSDLARAGYVPVPRSGPTLTVYPLDLAPGVPRPTLLNNWSSSIGAFELF
ncbi:GNAT family N-acetyltransferase [Rubricoccus marinus]|uniref:N-acetyltransferase domain-containing protein n=1 Tax=Rubricoccus marinus TaxID=716817 RepID=A0A259U089_9BACT|nr:GNAT family N-acetyltransferase [Rubricoccus marinus]OZC03419.1 hypothetical protein BSZ36_10770 [Rubricoccus marinus]